MDEATIIILVVTTILSAVIFLVFYAIKKEKERSQNWSLLATDIGFKFENSNNSLVLGNNHFRTFTTGRSRNAQNVLTGQNGDINITITDYSYVSGTGKNKKTYQYTVCIFQKADLDLPNCYMRMQIAFFDFLGKLVGGQDIDFHEDQEFSKSFVLQGDDESMVRKVFNENVRKGFLDYKGKHFIFEGYKDQFLIHKGKRVAPDEVMGILEDAYKIIDLFLKNKP